MTPTTCVADSLTSINIPMDKNLSPIRNGHNTNYGLQISGGNEALRYFVSGQLFDEVGTYQMPEFAQRVSRRFAAHTTSRRVGASRSTPAPEPSREPERGRVAKDGPLGQRRLLEDGSARAERRQQSVGHRWHVLPHLRHRALQPRLLLRRDPWRAAVWIRALLTGADLSADDDRGYSAPVGQPRRAVASAHLDAEQRRGRRRLRVAQLHRTSAAFRSAQTRERIGSDSSSTIISPIVCSPRSS